VIKKWPEDKNEPASIDDLLDPIKETLKKTYSMRKKPLKGPVPWDGVDDVGPTARAVAHTKIAEILSPKDLQYHQERGRSLLDVLLLITLQLGIEQGRRIERQERGLYGR
jgi:hypothetical protein